MVAPKLSRPWSSGTLSRFYSPPSPTSSSTPREVAPFVDLRQGVVWLSCPLSKDGVPEMKAEEVEAIATSIVSTSCAGRANQVTANQIIEALLNPRRDQDSRYVRVIVPELDEALGFCTWDGDGHFDMRTYADTKLGPPTLGQIMRFLQQLETSSAEVALTIHITSPARVANGAVLAGANLVLARGLGAESAWREILRAVPYPSQEPSEAWDRFHRPFVPETVPKTSSCLTVFDCLCGLEAASELGWLCNFRSFDVEAWHLLRQKFDASWIIPGKVLAMGHPTTTAMNPKFPGLLDLQGVNIAEQFQDPNLTYLEPDGGACIPGSPAMLRTRLSSYASSTSETTGLGLAGAWDDSDPDNQLEVFQQESDAEESNENEMVVFQLVDLEDSNMAQRDAIWNKPRPSVNTAPELDQDVAACKTFMSYLTKKGVSLVASLHFPQECPSEASTFRRFEDAGLTCINFRFADGSVPEKTLVKEFLKASKSAELAGNAIAVHCIAGLGRTGVMIGTLAVSRYGISGTAFHGWCRLCRPGSVQTECQEVFLRGLKPASQSKNWLKQLRQVSSASTFVSNALRKVSSFGSTNSFGP